MNQNAEMQLSNDHAKDDALVPFGKYRGQPVESMLADQNYVQWVMTQPGIVTMLKGKYPTFFNIITIGAPTTDDTPEHNKLQAMFLDRDFQYAFIEASQGKGVYETSAELATKVNEKATDMLKRAVSFAEKDVEQSRERLKKAQEENAKTEQEDGESFYYQERQEHQNKERERYSKQAKQAAEQYLSHLRNPVDPIKPFPDYDDWTEECSYGSWPRKVRERKEALIKTTERLKKDQESLNKVKSFPFAPVTVPHPGIRMDFECGYDLHLSVAWYPEIKDIPSCSGYDYRDYSDREWNTVNARACEKVSFSIEIKPQMGDDFPSVLRQMKRNKSDTLVIGSFEATTCTLEQVRAIFGEKKIITLEEIQAIKTKGVWPE